MLDSLSLTEKSELFETVLASEWTELMQLDLVSGEGRLLYSTDSAWKRMIGLRFDFPSVVEHYLNNTCANPGVFEILESVRPEKIGSALEQQDHYSVFYTIRGKDGAFLQKRITFYRTGDVIVPVSIKDVTEGYHSIQQRVLQLESALSDARQELAEKNAFLSMMSRNIRTPLYSIMGLSRIAEDTGASEASAIDSYLHKISMSGSYMNETIDDILELRHIARRKISLHPEIIDLGKALNHGEQAMMPHLKERNLKFSSKYEDAVGLMIEADPHALREVCQKLLFCMSSHLVAGGRIEFRVREMFRSEGKVTLEFSAGSRGILLDQERISSLFSPFDTLDGYSIRDDLTPLDISLIILKSYANALGARSLTAVTDEVRGTSIAVTLTFPLKEDLAYAEASDVNLSEIDFSNIRALVVDDNNINLEVVTRLLTGKGFHVTTAMNGQDALDCYKASGGQFDLILMDILMPVMDGLTSTRELRALENEIPGSAKIPIIAMTANAFRKDFEESMRAGMDAHLVKPVDPDRLLRLIAVLLNLCEEPV